jgi:hypothetical protein
MDLIGEIGRWLAELEPSFAFLLALPFAVGAIGLLVEWRQTREQRRRRHTARAHRAPGGVAPVR